MGHACRKIAGLERLLLNADAGWRPAASRSMDLDALPASALLDAPCSSATADPNSRRGSAVTQSMPADQWASVQRASSASGAIDSSRREGVPATPPRVRAIALPTTILEARPNTAAPERGRCFKDANPRELGMSPNMLDGHAAAAAQACSRIEAGHHVQPNDLQDRRSSVAEASASPGLLPRAPMARIGAGNQNGVEALQQEYRTARLAGPAGEDNVHARLARLEMQLRNFQVHAPPDRSCRQLTSFC